ncbi:monocarboxylate transporter [Fusarium heterosporum]|uniref:Monocarboxylate transporter n=1 Tax=Fusarium heterosporum TaxID=42747 RepID=A0A8H5WM59_FUSHE|nr:monocarboxylate transporter [Fusarium heterosporum]
MASPGPNPQSSLVTSEDGAAPPDQSTEQESVQEKAPTTDFGPPPDGGLEAWSVVAGGFCAVFASFGWINCIGIFQDYYQRNQLKAYSSSTVAWIPSVESFMMFFWGPVVGKMTDELGPRIPILIGSFLHVFGIMMTSISKEYYQILLSQSFCSAIGCSFLFYAPIAAVGTWFARHRAIAFGIVTAGSSLGGVALPIMAKALGVSPHLAGYMVPIVNASSTFGRLLPAYLGDRIGVFNVMIPLTVLGGIFTLTVWLTATSTASVIVYAVLYGFTSGCTLSIVPAMVASFSDVRSIGTRNGSLYCVAAVGALIGSPVAGAIVGDQNGHFSGLIIFCGVSILLGAVFATMSRHSLAGGKWRKKV